LGGDCQPIVDPESIIESLHHNWTGITRNPAGWTIDQDRCWRPPEGRSLLSSWMHDGRFKRSDSSAQDSLPRSIGKARLNERRSNPRSIWPNLEQRRSAGNSLLLI